LSPPNSSAFVMKTLGVGTPKPTNGANDTGFPKIESKT